MILSELYTIYRVRTRVLFRRHTIKPAQFYAQNIPSGKIRVFLVGTGGPEFTKERYGICTVIEVKGKLFMFDVGRGAAQRLYELGIRPDRIENIFLTHLHNDHYEGLPNLWMTPWFLFGSERNMQVTGPVGTASMIEGMYQMYAHDVVHRPNQKFKKEYLAIKVAEFNEGELCYNKDGITITSFAVEHGDGNPAFGYSLEYDGYKVVLSGDTCYHDNVVAYGKSADVLLHNVIAIPPKTLQNDPDFLPVLKKLCTPESAAAVFLASQPRLAVYSHICKKGMPGAEGDEATLAMTREAGYSGPLVMGQDRMVIDIGVDIEVYFPNDLSEISDLQ